VNKKKQKNVDFFDVAAPVAHLPAGRTEIFCISAPVRTQFRKILKLYQKPSKNNFIDKRVN
jgi:hypothetical protein